MVDGARFIGEIKVTRNLSAYGRDLGLDDEVIQRRSLPDLHPTRRVFNPPTALSASDNLLSDRGIVSPGGGLSRRRRWLPGPRRRAWENPHRGLRGLGTFVCPAGASVPDDRVHLQGWVRPGLVDFSCK